jgi:hypothetical protein
MQDPPAEISVRVSLAIRVPSDQQTIQAAINAANNGNTVLVAPGTYFENIYFRGKAITVTSESGPDVTKIDGGGADSVVIFNSREGRDSVINGFTLQNGNPGVGGGGVRIASASPTVTNNVITNNRGCTGAGVYVISGSPLIQLNIITGNDGVRCGAGGGGILVYGISVDGASSPEILDNVISNNNSLGDGGGIFLNGDGTPTIKRNIIKGNTAQGGKGGGIYMVNHSDALIVQNLIINNQASVGGGLYWYVPSAASGPILVNNTIVDNDAASGGSGIYAEGFDAQTELTNNIIAAKPGQAGLYCGDLISQSQPIIRFNNIFGAAGGMAYGGNCSDMTGMNGNISADPLFANQTQGDYHLQRGSPSIDSGDNQASNLPNKDLDGDLRILDGDGDGTPIVDMGVDEFTGQDRSLPTSIITAPTEGATVLTGTTVNITGIASAAPGRTVVMVEVSVDGGSTWNVATGTTAWSYNWTPALAGPTTIKSRAIDNGGNLQDHPAQLAVTVQGRTPPTSTVTSPAPGATVFTGTTVTISGTASNTGGGSVARVEVSVNGGATYSAATGTTSWSFSWTPITPGQMTIRSRAVDSSGNAQDPPAQITVVVVDRTPPTVTSFSPAPGAINVSLHANVTATFNEQIDSSTVNNSTVQLQDPSGALTPATVSYKSASRAATLAPTAPLATGVKYTAVVKGGDAGIKDLAGNPLAADLTWSFMADTPPQVLSITPARGAVNISPGVTPAATFSQLLDPTTVNSSTVTLTDATAMPVNSKIIIYARSVRRILLVPDEPLQYGQTYTMTLKGGPGSPQITSLAGTPLASDYTWSFTTASRDTDACDSVSFNTTPRIDLPQDIYGNLLLVKDFNQDSRLDLVTVKGVFGAKQLLFFPGASDGGFGSPVNALSLPNDRDQFSDLAAGDFNNDGALDIAAIGNLFSPSARSLWIILNNGAGGFAAPLTINISVSPKSVTAGDFNSDGKTDLVIAVTGGLDFDALLFLNDGTGGFGLPRQIRPGLTRFWIQDKVKSVDVDSDGKLDLVFFNTSAANGAAVTIYKGDGAGGFSFQPIPGGLVQGFATAIGDFNGDGSPDILSVQPGESMDEIVVLPNDGTGRFGPQVRTLTGQPFSSVEGAIAEDFDGDGKTDVALRPAGQGNFTGIILFTATTGGRFSEPIIYQPSVVAPAMAAGDFNRDGLPDILSMNNTGQLTIVSAQGGGFNAPRGFDFTPPMPFFQQFNASDLKSGDLNGDGAPDLVITAGGLSDAVIMFGDGRGEFGAPVSINTGVPSDSLLAIELQDFNNDGKPDLAALASYPTKVVVLLGDGQGGFTPSATINAGTGVVTITSGDFNNDGKLDLVVKAEASGLALYLGDGQGGFTQIATGIGGDIGSFYFTAGDFNGDSNRDLAIYDKSQSGIGDGFNIVILPGDGQGGFGQPSNVMVQERLRFLSAKDLNLDGRDDLFYTPDYIGDAVYVALSNPGGGFDAPVAYPVGGATLLFTTIPVTASDINGDGKPDLLASSSDTGTVSLLLGDGAGGFSQQRPLPAFNVPGLIVTGDFDGDGRIDLAMPRNGAAVIAIINNKSMCIPQSDASPASSASDK